VDRHYIARFLEAHGADIRGRVLEVGSDDYTRRYGGAAVSGVEVLDVSPRNPRATIVADLNDPQGLPAGRFDCVICTQTLLLVYDVRAAVGTLHAALAAGGVLLVTVPGISRICQPEGDLWGDYWRFTSASLRRLLEERFGPSGVAVEAFGNVLAATAALHGLAAEELGDRKLALRDPDYEVIVAARARKA
jgi:SAM-dependent methyltransferase